MKREKRLSRGVRLLPIILLRYPQIFPTWNQFNNLYIFPEFSVYIQSYIIFSFLFRQMIEYYIDQHRDFALLFFPFNIFFRLLHICKNGVASLKEITVLYSLFFGCTKIYNCFFIDEHLGWVCFLSLIYFKD